jgi:hypothetical protein
MYLFKTSGETFESVIQNQRHAYPNKPRSWYRDEIVLVSKNKDACSPGEKQIQYVMRIQNIRQVENDEIERYWPGNRGRWKWIIDGYDTIKLIKPFDLRDVIGERASVYLHVVNFKKVKPEDEIIIINFFERNGDLI